MNRSFANRQWMRRSNQNSGQTAETASKEVKLRILLQRYLIMEREVEKAEPIWQEINTFVSSASEHFNMVADEPGIVFIESLVTKIRPRRLLMLLKYLTPETNSLIFKLWNALLEAIPLNETSTRSDYIAAAHAYAAYRARAVAKCLENRFIEGGNSDYCRGDLYLTRDDHYYYNFTYLCGDFAMNRNDTIDALYKLADEVYPTEEQLECLGGADDFSKLIESELNLDGDAIPHALAELLPLLERKEGEDIVPLLPQNLISKIAVSAVSRKLGFSLPATSILEIYEICTVYEATGESIDKTRRFLFNLFNFEPDEEECISFTPSSEWQLDWNDLIRTYGTENVTAWVKKLLPVYNGFSVIVGYTPYFRITAGWQATCLDCADSAEWLVIATSEMGFQAPICAASLLHSNMSVTALTALAQRWEKRVAEVPLQTSWSRETIVLVLKYAISMQRCWLLDRLANLYLRGGGFEAGQTRESITDTLERLLDAMKLTDTEQKKLDAMGLHFELLPDDINIFTGERVDASRWASPTSAYKYIRTLLRLEDRNTDYLTSLVSEKRIVALEKSLRRLDFHTSIQQIVLCTHAFENPADALAFLLALRHSAGERPTKDWLAKMQSLISKLNEDVACQLLWDCYKFDNGDAYSFNPGIFWALRLVPTPQSVAQIAKAATEMVRRKPSFAIAALDTLNSISTRSSLSAILQMRRRIRNRKVVKLINRTIDRIANEDGLDRDVFLDYAVDTGDLEDDSSRLFDFGSHQVTLKLELDGKISTTVLDAKGRKLRSFPKTAKDADPVLYKEFQSTKKLLVETITYQTRRLEQSMINGRTWLGRDFIEIFQAHPVMRFLGRRIVWGRVPEPGSHDYDLSIMPTDDSFINVQGEHVTIGDDDLFIVIHPLYFKNDEKAQWHNLLKNAKIDQPFPQTGREIYEPLPEELKSGCLKRIVGTAADANELYRIVKERGWTTDGGGPWEVGSATHSHRPYTTACQTAHLDTDVLGYDKFLKITGISFTKTGDTTPLKVNEINRIVYSEAFRDIYLCYEN